MKKVTTYDVLDMFFDIANEFMNMRDSKGSADLKPIQASLLSLGNNGAQEKDDFYKAKIARQVCELADETVGNDRAFAIAQLDRIASSCDDSFYRNAIMKMITGMGMDGNDD